MLNYSERDFGCPVQCRYCAVTKVDRRRRQWNKKTLIGLNASVTIINPPPHPTRQSLREFYTLPPELFRGDRIGFNAISDPFWPKYRLELDYFLAAFSPFAKIITAVTKFPVAPEIMEKLSKVSNFRLVVTVTGLDSLEKVSTARRLEVLRQARYYGLQAFPIIHPYIAGLTDLTFLSALKKNGYDKIGIKGLRYNSRTMDSWLPSASRSWYSGHAEKEILPDDGWRKKITQTGLEITDLRSWYDSVCPETPRVSQVEARQSVMQILPRANITSSRSTAEVIDSAIRRRL